MGTQKLSFQYSQDSIRPYDNLLHVRKAQDDKRRVVRRADVERRVGLPEAERASVRLVARPQRRSFCILVRDGGEEVDHEALDVRARAHRRQRRRRRRRMKGTPVALQR